MRSLATFALLPAALVVAAAALTITNPHPAPAGTASLADAFIRSVVTRNGDLGWQQLCLPLQRALPRQTLETQAQAQKAAEAGTGLSLSSTFVSQQSQPQGGEVRVYHLRAQRADGWSGQRTYRVFTANGGCVGDVQTGG